jgi:hypothetical protein
MEFAPQDANGSTISLNPPALDGLHVHKDAKTDVATTRSAQMKAR